MAVAQELLLDTNVVLELLRKSPAGQRIDREFSLSGELGRNLICVVTAGELLALARRFGWGTAKIDLLTATLNELVVLDINDAVVWKAYAEIAEFTVRSGRTMGQNDLWIAATARAYDVPLLTTDRDFDHLNGKLLTVVWVNPKADTP